MHTTEEYNKKLQELRDERDFHQKEYRRLMEEMDHLELDQNEVPDFYQKYFIIDYTKEGGYKEYFHVDTYYKRPRGITLLGKGFSINSKGNHINIDDAHFLRWTDINLPIEITPEEYIDTFEDYINTVKLNLIKFREHRPEQDEFKFKKDLEEGRIKIKWEGLNN